VSKWNQIIDYMLYEYCYNDINQWQIINSSWSNFDFPSGLLDLGIAVIPHLRKQSLTVLVDESFVAAHTFKGKHSYIRDFVPK